MELGLRAAAKALGISHPALIKAVKAGRVPRKANGNFDLDICKVAMAQNSNPAKQRAARTQQKAPVASPATEPPPQLPPSSSPERHYDPDDESSDDHSGTYTEALRRHEWLKVQERDLTLRQKRGELRPIAEINAYIAGMIIRSRDILLRVGPELRDRLAQETDPNACDAMVTAEIHRALDALSEYHPEVN